MKWSLQQLFKYNGKPFTFQGTYDFKEYIEPIDDILDITEVYVDGVGQNVIDDRYSFKLHIKTILILEDSRTLQPIEFPIDLEVVEEFDKNEDADANLILKNTIDLETVVWENVLLQKPISITNSSDENIL